MAAVRRAWVSWSSGKDSAHALHVARAKPDLDVVGLLTTVTEPFDRVSMHGVRRELLEVQAQRLGLPLHTVELPFPCSNAEYERRMAQAIEVAHADGIGAMIFGDLFLSDVRASRERMLAPTGIEPLFPLWERPTAELAQEILATGVVAHVTCLDPNTVPQQLAGMRWDVSLLRRLPSWVDPCGERGEFHTFVSDAPGFSAPMAVTPGEIVERDGFVFADLQSDETPRAVS